MAVALSRRFESHLKECKTMTERIDDLEEAVVMFRKLDFNLFITPERLQNEISKLEIKIKTDLDARLTELRNTVTDKANDVLDRCVAVVRERVGKRDFYDQVNFL